MLTGVIAVDKPVGLTSHDVVKRVRKLTDQRRCGHTGTLDPFATGLLLVCLGRATRLSRFLTAQRKTYLATLRFGFATDTYDRTGSPVGEPVPFDARPEELETLFARFVGKQLQRPPRFSAKKIGGTRAYRLARRGEPAAPAPVEVEIGRIELLGLEGPLARIVTTVSSGTYMRSLAYDVGQALGCGAHLEALRRTHVGSFTVDEASELDALDAAAARGSLEDSILTPLEALRDLRSLRVDSESASKLGHGRSLSWGARLATGATYRVLGPAGELVAVVTLDEATGTLKPVIVWATPV